MMHSMHMKDEELKEGNHATGWTWDHWGFIPDLPKSLPGYWNSSFFTQKPCLLLGMRSLIKVGTHVGAQRGYKICLGVIKTYSMCHKTNFYA